MGLIDAYVCNARTLAVVSGLEMGLKLQAAPIASEIWFDQPARISNARQQEPCAFFNTSNKAKKNRLLKDN
ncbi:hypothetical protein L596_001111 [Steinernema carpocapsae]|uniref:Uncharacterized protein n=1 Tax=Steinernema carpocapsae TaxID=34508 RepID=A0A4U8UPB4_STECR|nr:hypothetical protein L596_001111 [Steinernema carpocapsae]